MAVRNTKKPATKVAVVESAQKAEVLSKVKDMTTEKAGTTLAKAQAEVSRQFADIQAKLTENMQTLANVEQAIVIKQQELKELHGLADVAMAQATLDDQIVTTREQWAREKADRERVWQEEREDYAKQRSRNELEWNYEFDINKKKKLQALNDELASAKRAHDEQIAVRSKQLDERQQAIDKAEKELAELRTLGATFNDRVAKEVKSQTEAAANAIRKQAEHEKALSAADTKSQVALANARVESANNEIAALRDQLSEANKTIAALRDDVKSISTSALEASSGRKALDAVMQQSSVASSQPAQAKR